MPGRNILDLLSFVLTLRHWCGLWNRRRIGSLSKLLKLLILRDFTMNDLRAERLQVMLSPEELSVLDDFRFKHRMPTRAAAVRELLKLGLASAGVDAGTGGKSSDYGVFGRGPDGHAPSNGGHDGEA
jgi:hypothetical protein